MDRQRLLDKLARLKALSECQTGNVHETATAAAAMARLMLEYKIELAEIEPQPGVIEEMELDGERARPFPIWQNHLLHCLASANDCVGFQTTTNQWSPWNGRQRTARLNLLGRREDLDNTRRLFTFCLQEIERLCRNWKPARGMRLKNDFRTGAAAAIAETVRQATEAVIQEAEERGSRALVLLERNLDQVEEAARKIGVKPARSRGTRYVSMEAYQAGYQAGQQVILPNESAAIT
ncbi:hypothetical protein ABS71_22155 [bacterium SCN 62-11]|nr:hypothetical protein [Candidatus Eremiobacteraeota bacterium]ODT56170.1 MAG: hypothetical protein ABS71_22155 [bacterium SCN 62-11]